MGRAKALRVAPIGARDANRFVVRVHYSHKRGRNVQLNLGVFISGRLEGVMQFGPPLDRRKLLGLVEGTAWNGFLELNRLAFSEALPRNSESRALAVAFRMLRNHSPQTQWIVSFADATQCGDGAIYRASGFALIGIKKNSSVWVGPNGETIVDVATRTIRYNHGSSMKAYREAGFHPLPGYQLRYIYFLDPTARDRLTVPILPFSEIERQGARMYKGKRVVSDTGDTSAVQAEKGGSTPTTTLQT